VTTVSKQMATQFDETLNWKDTEWIRSSWQGKIVVKGILDVEDAKIAARLGVPAIVISNHDERRLNGELSSALPGSSRCGASNWPPGSPASRAANARASGTAAWLEIAVCLGARRSLTLAAAWRASLTPGLSRTSELWVACRPVLKVLRSYATALAPSPGA
jgi:FMN-dependent dehydrogenase